jgi:hypothetical protein
MTIRRVVQVGACADGVTIPGTLGQASSAGDENARLAAFTNDLARE